METGIHVGTKVNKEDVDNFSGAVDQIFKSAFEYRMDQEIVGQALRSLSDTFTVKSMTVQNCTVTGDKIVNVDKELLED